jgi:hypothetical protein
MGSSETSSALALAIVVLGMLLCGHGNALAQITIRNPQRFEVPQEENVQILFNTVCKVVAEELHEREPSKFEFPLTLVLGAADEHVVEDEDNRFYAIYMNQWNEVKFAISAMRLAVQRTVPRSRRDKMVVEILRRSSRIQPVPLKSLRDHGGNPSPVR